jgi:H3 lysine-79-specific histone-lysine N-methyltransferase
LRAERPFSDQDGRVLIHAADVANKNDYSISVELQYPAAVLREKYAIFMIRSSECKADISSSRYRTFFEKDKDDNIVLRPVDEFITISEVVANTYLTAEQRTPFTDPEPNPGILRKLQRAGKLLEVDSLNPEKQQRFIDAVNAYNAALEKLMKDGVVNKNLNHVHQITFKMVDCILDQVYERAVSPHVKLLTKMKAENTKDNTYGELLHKFVSQIISETKLKSDQVFVDLGSGVGNVVLQAALEVGCESWGCEMMEAACDIAEFQEREFDVRCRLWGIKPGKVRLERGDFRESTATKEAMRRADVILVNNEVFGSDLNQNLIDMFLDLKDGCKIVSLKSFVPTGYKRTPRNTENPVNLLDNERKEYSNNFVSWKDDRGSYYIATKDSARLGKFD